MNFGVTFGVFVSRVNFITKYYVRTPHFITEDEQFRVNRHLKISMRANIKKLRCSFLENLQKRKGTPRESNSFKSILSTFLPSETRFHHETNSIMASGRLGFEEKL